MSPSPVRTGGVLLLAATTGLLLAVQGTASAEPVTADPTEAAAGWLATQLVDGDGDGVGDHIEVWVDLNGDGQVSDDELFPDYGLTADSIIALAAAGVGGDASAAATDYLEDNVELYVGDAEGVGDPDGEFYAGSLAKTLLVADVTGRDPADFGGIDVLGRLLSTETPSGRFSDISAFGDFSNNIGQSLAVVALQRAAPDQLSPEAAGFLATQQCTDVGDAYGNVPLLVDADACLPYSVSVDATAFAVQAMLAVGDQEAAGAGLDFLLGAQAADGSFSDMDTANSNSTGLAAQALRAGGADDAADDAAGWLLDIQLGCSSPPEQQGAIAFTTGADGQPVYDDRAPRATSQAAPGLAGVGLADVSAEGSTPAAPRLACAAPTTAPTTTPAPTPTEPTTTAPSTGTTAPPMSSRPGLPVTGTDVGGLAGLAAASVLIGTVLVVAASRRRSGAHQ